ncbi:MAG: hypothetical protein ACRDHM_02500 [Actinomycetota bacterium]
MSRSCKALIASAALATLATPALAAHGGIHPTFRSENVFFHCTGPTKVQNVNYQLAGGSPSWNTSEPTQSYTQGGGCGTLDTFLYVADPESVYDAAFKGTFTGNLRNMTVRLHNLLLGRIRTTENTQLAIRLLIDGEQYIPSVASQPYGSQVDVAPVLSSTGLSELLEFSITGLGSATEVTDSQGNVIDIETTGLATEDGDGTAEHEVVLTVTPFFTPYSNAFVWDATEIASGISFNPPTLAAARLAATPPS